MFPGTKVIIQFLIFSILNGAPLHKPSPVPDFAGEFIHYNLKYGIFKIGVASISCFEDQTGCGEIIRAEAQSTGLMKIFRDLDYRFECCMDPNTGLPVSAIMDLRDGNITSYCKTQFDHYSRKDSTIVYSQKTGEHIVLKNIHDILTGFYCFRKDFYAESMTNGLPVVIPTFIADMIWDLRIKYTGGETINTLYGQLPCQKFNSSTVVGDFFRNDDDMTIWFTEDEIPIPIRIQLNLKLGSVKGELEEYQKPVAF
jgi:hypothetical protein